jgi:ABC-type polar amino acid transport system ATPase subunit
VLRGIDLDVSRAEVVSVIGKSGSGKSTLLRCLNLLEQPTGGAIEVGGEHVYGAGRALRGRELVALRRRIGMVFQSLCLFPHLSAVENVAMPLIRGLGVGHEEAVRRSVEFLGRVGLADRALELPRRLSGGQQQRVAIARALALRPVALLFDEPTSALDPESTAEVLAVMRELRDEGMTMIVVTHELGFAGEASDRIGFIDDGAFLEIGPPDGILENPRHERTREFVSRYRRRPS